MYTTSASRGEFCPNSGEFYARLGSAEGEVCTPLVPLPKLKPYQNLEWIFLGEPDVGSAEGEVFTLSVPLPTLKHKPTVDIFRLGWASLAPPLFAVSS